MDNNNFIEKLVIKDLFFEGNNFQAPFSNNLKIVTGENGSGKTTVMSILYYSLLCKTEKLKSYSFSKIKILFSSGREAVVKNPNFKSSKKFREGLLRVDQINDPTRHFFSFLEYASGRDAIIKDFLLNDVSQFDSVPRIMRRLDNSGILDYLRNGYKSYFSDFLNHQTFVFPSLHDMAEIIQGFIGVRHEDALLRAPVLFAEGNLNREAFSIIRLEMANYSILYLPTYRRIEEDLSKLNPKILSKQSLRGGKISESGLLRFGMSDVIEKLKSVKSEILKLSSQGLAKISGEILSELINEQMYRPEDSIKKINKSNIRLVLNRVGGALSERDKNKVLMALEDSRSLRHNGTLLYFLVKLSEIYESQREIDENIKLFVKTCNFYLARTGKRIIYNENEVKFNLEMVGAKKFLDLELFLEKFSSGEKQIISLFSRVYLDGNEKLVVLFDEPELSLSVPWQERLIDDIWKSNKCKFLFVATHSPFIFRGEYIKNTTSLSRYLKG